MAQTTINDSDTGLVARTGINDNFTELYTKIITGGTQGDIIYRNASGWVYLSAGTAEQILTTKGAAANPVWQDAPSAATTVGTSGDYATVSAAITAGQYDLKLISNVTEVASISISSITVLDLAEYTLDMGVYNFSAITAPLKVTGVKGTGQITYAYIIKQTLFTSSNENLVIENIVIDNNSTIAGCAVSQSYGFINNITLYLPNVSYGGFASHGSETFGGGVITNSEFIGGGSSCSYAINASNNNNLFSGLKFTGTYVGNNVIAYIKYLKNTTTDFTTTGNSRLNLVNANNVHDIASTKTLMVNLQYGGRYADISAKSHYSTDITGHCTRVYIEDDITIEASNATLIDCWTDGDIIVEQDNNTLIGCKADSGTITVDATADKTIIMGCRTLTNIVDNGTNTEGSTGTLGNVLI